MKPSLRIALLIAFACFGSAAAAEIVEFKSPAVAGNTGVSCNLDKLMPKRFVVYATSAYGGRESTAQIDDSGHAATEFDVAVHSPDLPVVVALAAYEPTVWRIGWSEKTRIVAVVASGYHRQVVLGMPKGTPVLTLGMDSQCPRFSYFLNSQGSRLSELSNANRAMSAIVGQGIDRVYAPKGKGEVVLGETAGGERYLTSNDFKLSDFVAADQPKAGRAGVEDAMQRGILRLAREEDLRAALTTIQVRAQSGDKRSPEQIAKQSEEWLRRNAERSHVWVVQKEFTFPAGLYGANSEVFIVPAGVPEPKGNPGHSTVLRAGGGTCTGPACPR